MKIELSKNTLYKKTEKVTLENLNEVLSIANEIKKWIKDQPAYAVAFNQLGFKHNCFILSEGKIGIPNTIIINPEFYPQKKSKETISIEGCLSFPNRKFKIKRFNKIIFHYLDINLKPKKWKMHGTHAVICQHEIMHLNGQTELDFDIEDLH